MGNVQSLIDQQFYDQAKIFSGQVDEENMLQSPKLKYKIPFYYKNKCTQSLIIQSHSNCVNLNKMIEWYENKVSEKMSISILIYEQSGFGSTEEVNTTEELIKDNIKIAYRQATKTLGQSPENIILWGRSLGTGPSCQLAKKQPLIGALIIESGFTSIFNTYFNIDNIQIPLDKQRNSNCLKKVKCPVIIIHAKNDNLVPVSHAQNNFKSIKHENKQLVLFNEGGHNQIEFQNENWQQGNIQRFLSHQIENIEIDNSIKQSYTISTPSVQAMVYDNGKLRSTSIAGNFESIQQLRSNNASVSDAKTSELQDSIIKNEKESSNNCNLCQRTKNETDN